MDLPYKIEDENVIFHGIETTNHIDHLFMVAANYDINYTKITNLMRDRYEFEIYLTHAS